MTPDLGTLFGPAPDSAVQAQIRAYQDALRLAQQDERRMITGRYAAIYCTCTMYRTPAHQPAQAGCVVHGGFMITPEGEVI